MREGLWRGVLSASLADTGYVVLNGRVVVQDRHPGALRGDELSVSCELPRGMSEIIVCVARRVYEWGFAVRFHDRADLEDSQERRRTALEEATTKAKSGDG